jgi:TPR repeat protein
MTCNWNARSSRLSSVCLLMASFIPFTISSAWGAENQGSNTLLSLPASGDVRTKAEQGYLQQQLVLAAAYFMGRGVPRDLSQAAYWYRKAADQGNPSAQVELGYFYHAGIGVPRNDAEAVRWYQRAAGGGSARGKLNLAVMYLNGDGVRQDTPEACRLLRSAASEKDGTAEAYLGVMSYFGLGMPVDKSAAEKWFRDGAKHHSPEAEYDLASLYSVNADHVHDIPKAAGLLRLAASEGYVPAEHSLGVLLINHPDLRQKPGEAVSMLSSAAEGGSWRSSVMLGMLARDGKLGAKDQQAAYRWFRIATLQAGDEARPFLENESGSELPQLTAVERKAADDEARVWFQAHPHKDVFRFDAEQAKKFFPHQEIEAAQTAPVSTEVAKNAK